MSLWSSDSEEISDSEKVCKKLVKAFQKFKNEIKSLKRENESLKLENKSLRQQLEVEENPAKKKIQCIKFDPFKALNEYCIIEILKQLNGSDLYNMTKVSKRWKSIVESNTRAAEELEKFLTIEIKSYRDFVKTESDGRDIEYKHVTIKMGEVTLLSFDNFVTSSLESLTVHSMIEWTKIKQTKFPALQKLEVQNDHGEIFRWAASKEFPVLTEFINVESEDDDECDWWHGVEISFNSFSKLKHLHLVKLGYEETLIKSDKFENPPFHLESLTCRFYLEKFCKSQAQTLKKLKCYVMDFLDYQNLLLTLSNLISLSIVIVYFRNSQHQAPFPLIRNEKITKLKYGPKNDYYGKKYHLYSLSQVLTSLPELKTFVLYDELTPNILKVAARVNLKLTKIICKKKSADLEVIYESLKTAEVNNHEFNKKIEIICNRKLSWYLHFTPNFVFDTERYSKFDAENFKKHCQKYYCFENYDIRV